jgi:hypothetical protein
MAFSTKTKIHDDKVDLIRLPISKRINLYDFEIYLGYVNSLYSTTTKFNDMCTYSLYKALLGVCDRGGAWSRMGPFGRVTSEGNYFMHIPF